MKHISEITPATAANIYQEWEDEGVIGWNTYEQIIFSDSRLLINKGFSGATYVTSSGKDSTLWEQGLLKIRCEWIEKREVDIDLIPYGKVFRHQSLSCDTLDGQRVVAQEISKWAIDICHTNWISDGEQIIVKAGDKGVIRGQPYTVKNGEKESLVALVNFDEAGAFNVPIHYLSEDHSWEWVYYRWEHKIEGHTRFSRQHPASPAPTHERWVITECTKAEFDAGMENP